MKAGAARPGITVSPCLLVEDIQGELEFLRTVFGARAIQSGSLHAGTFWQAEAQLGDTVLKIGRTHPDHAQAASLLYVWVDDVDAVFARALEAGASPIGQPREQNNGIREAGFRDPQGSTWWIGARRRKPSNREVEQRLDQQRRKRL